MPFTPRDAGASTCEVEVSLTDGEKVLFSMVPREGALLYMNCPCLQLLCPVLHKVPIAKRTSVSHFTPSLLFFTGVAAIESLLSTWAGALATNEDDAGSSSGDDEDSEYMDSDGDSESESGSGSSSGSGSGSDDESGSGGGGSSSSSDASDIDRAELDALLDESRDVLGDGALGGGGGPRKRLRR